MHMEKRLNWNSHQLTRGWQKGVTAFYWGLGFKEEDLDKAQVGIGSPSWMETFAICMPMNWHN